MQNLLSSSRLHGAAIFFRPPIFLCGAVCRVGRLLLFTTHWTLISFDSLKDTEKASEWELAGLIDDILEVKKKMSVHLDFCDKCKCECNKFFQSPSLGQAALSQLHHHSY